MTQMGLKEKVFDLRMRMLPNTDIGKFLRLSDELNKVIK